MGYRDVRYRLTNGDGNTVTLAGRAGDDIRALVGRVQWTCSWPVRVETVDGEGNRLGDVVLEERDPMAVVDLAPVPAGLMEPESNAAVEGADFGGEQVVTEPDAVPEEAEEEAPRPSGRRVVFRVQASREGGWDIRRSKEVVAHLDTKAQAIHTGSDLCREIQAAGGRAQLVVYNKDGEISEERTFGGDPERRPG